MRYHPFGVQLVAEDTIRRTRAIAFVIDLRRKFSGNREHAQDGRGCGAELGQGAAAWPPTVWH